MRAGAQSTGSISHRPSRPLRRLSSCAIALFVLTTLLSPNLAPGQVGGAGGDPRGTNPDAQPSDSGSVPDLAAIERAFQGVVRQVTPSVVGIRAHRQYWVPAAGTDAPDKTQGVEQLAIVHGSGTIIRADGSILTNQHVIQSAGDIEVILHDGRNLPATVVAADPRSDLAILRVDGAGLPPVALCDWSAVARGQWSIAVGNPYGLGNDGKQSVSVGVISNLGRRLPGLGEVDDRLYADMIQTTAPVHPGNSGGPLFNLRGELIGVITAVHVRTIDDQGAGFAIPMSPARRRVIEQLLQGQPVAYGYLGITVRTLEPGERTRAGLDGDLGVLVEQIETDGPAAKAGLQTGDIVTHLDACPVTAPLQLADLVGQVAASQNVELKILRGGTVETRRATLEPRQINHVAWLRSGAILWRGMRLTELTPETRRYAKVDADGVGLVVLDVQLDSPAAHARVQVGDVLESVAGSAAPDTQSFLLLVRGRDEAVQMHFRQGGAITVTR